MQVKFTYLNLIALTVIINEICIKELMPKYTRECIQGGSKYLTSTEEK